MLSAFLLVLAVLHYLLGARADAVTETIWHCSESRKCSQEYVKRLANVLAESSLLPAFLDTRTSYARGVLADYLAMDDAIPRQEQLEYRKEAIGYFRNAVRERPLWSLNWLALGNDYMLIGKFAEAQDALTQLLDRDPFPPFHFDLLSQALNYSVLWDDAFRKYLVANLRAFLTATEWGGRHIRMAVDVGYADDIRGVLHNDWQMAELMHAEKRRDESRP